MGWIECYTTTPLPLNLYLLSDSPKQLKKNTKNPFVRNTIDVWFKVQSHFGLKSQISSFTPVWGNRRFIPGTYDSGFKMWANRGINKISDLYDDNKLMTFEMLRNKPHIPSTHFFKYLQLRSYISKAQNHSLLCPPLSKLETIIVHHSSGHGQVSLIYDLCKTESEESSENKRLAWSTDLNAEVTIEEWGQICHKAQVQTINTRFRLRQYKWIMRTYITPSLLHHFDANIPDQCVKCDNDKGTLFHCLWDCPNIKSFWKDVLGTLSKIISATLPECPKLCILGVFPLTPRLNITKKRLVFSLLQAKHTIAVFWKNPENPSINHWLKDLSHCLALEKLTFAIKGKPEVFHQIWGEFLEFLEINVPPN